MKNCYGFTMAEVLITLGIVGVVAAMTMPTLIANYKRKELEVSFNKSYSALQQAVVAIEPDIIASLGGTPGEVTEYYQALFSKYKIVDDKTQVSDMYYTNRRKLIVKNYNLQQGEINGCAQLPRKIAADGNALGGNYNCYANWLTIDTNGPRRGPNAYGHDLFFFGLSNKGQLVPLGNPYHWEMNGNSTYCSKNSTNPQNGTSCAKFAIENVCPDDSTKTYWECLP